MYIGRQPVGPAIAFLLGLTCLGLPLTKESCGPQWHWLLSFSRAETEGRLSLFHKADFFATLAENKDLWQLQLTPAVKAVRIRWIVYPWDMMKNLFLIPGLFRCNMLFGWHYHPVYWGILAALWLRVTEELFPSLTLVQLRAQLMCSSVVSKLVKTRYRRVGQCISAVLDFCFKSAQLETMTLSRRGGWLSLLARQDRGDQHRHHFQNSVFVCLLCLVLLKGTDSQSCP